MSKIDVLVGLQHGDEGKGKISYVLSQQNNYDVFVRFNGGSNAGHTVYVDGESIVLHQIPCGILVKKKCLISSGCVIDLKGVQEEMEAVRKLGINAEEFLHFSYNAHVILPEYIEEDIRTDRIGSTNRGIAPTYGRKHYRTGIRIEDKAGADGKLLGCKIVNSFEFLKDKENIMFEGAQGFELDIDWGHYPYVTSSSCISGNVFLNGVPPQPLNEVYGVAKAYETYVGKKDFQPEDDSDLVRVQDVGKEYGATTGRKRQCNWLDMDRLLRSCYVNSVSTLILNKCDILKEVNVFKYYEGGKLHEVKDFEAFQEVVRNHMSQLASIKSIIFSQSPDTI